MRHILTAAQVAIPTAGDKVWAETEDRDRSVLYRNVLSFGRGSLHWNGNPPLFPSGLMYSSGNYTAGISHSARRKAAVRAVLSACVTRAEGQASKPWKAPG